MGRMIALLGLTLLLTTHLPARSHDWKNVEKLKVGDTITITQKDGKKVSGYFQSMNGNGLRIGIFERRGVGFGSFQDIERERIRKIVRLNEPNLPDPRKVMMAGAIVGGVAGGTAGAIRDSHTSPRTYNVVTGGAAGAVLGTLATTPVLLGFGVHALIHHHTVIYEDGTKS
jgi:hypothetical protein